MSPDVRMVRVVKTETHGLGVSIKGGKENNMPVIISKIFKVVALEHFAGTRVLFKIQWGHRLRMF